MKKALVVILMLLPAMTYAQGDVDMDHYVTSSDAPTALRSALGIITLDESAAELADYNSNGSVGSEDALMILRAALGIL